MTTYGAEIPTPDGRATADQADDVPQWAKDRVHAMTTSEVFATCAKLIALHETPPVDEATELWLEMRDAYDLQTKPGPIAILRDHLAKVRGE